MLGFHCWQKAPWPKLTWGEACFILQVSDHTPSEGRQDRNSRREYEAGKAGTEGKTAEVLHMDLFSLCRWSYLSHDHLQRAGTTHTGLAPPASMINQDNGPQTCLQAILMQEVSQLWFRLCRWTRHVTSLCLYQQFRKLLPQTEGLHWYINGCVHARVCSRVCVHVHMYMYECDYNVSSRFYCWIKSAIWPLL